MGLKENKKRLEAKLLSGEPIYKINRDSRQGIGLIPMTLTKVGNKYAECGREQIDIEELNHYCKGYSPDYRVYIDKEEYENEILKAKLLETIKSLVGGCSLDKIKMIHAVVVQASAENN